MDSALGVLPDDRPFTRSEARALGVAPARLAELVREGHLVSPVLGAMHASSLPDSLELRIACVKLVSPPDAVITDRTAGWLHFAPMVLAPGDHLSVPRVDVFRSPGNRMKRDAVRSGERGMRSDEIVIMDGLRVTSKLRTTCDLGMQLPRRPAFAAMCAMMKVADFTTADISRQADTRFRGYRWVRQLRSLAPHVSGCFDSQGECWLGLSWIDEPTLPPFVPQFEVPGPRGSYFLDLAVPDLRYAAEYDGEAWHGPAQEEHDRVRRDFLRDEGGWIIDVFRSEHVTGPSPRAGDLLREGIARARRRRGQGLWAGQDRCAASNLIARSAPYGVT